jgi:hypothetical protein
MLGRKVAPAVSMSAQSACSLKVRWAEFFRRILVERCVRIRPEVANKLQKLGNHKSLQHKVDPHDGYPFCSPQNLRGVLFAIC